MKYVLLVALFSIFLSPSVFATTFDIHIKDEIGNVISGVSVYIKEFALSGITDNTGTVIIDVPNTYSDGFYSFVLTKTNYKVPITSCGTDCIKIYVTYSPTKNNIYTGMEKDSTSIYNSSSDLPPCNMFGVNAYTSGTCSPNNIQTYKCTLTGITYNVKCDYYSTLTSLSLSLSVTPNNNVTIGTSIEFSIIPTIAKTPYKLYLTKDGIESFVLESSIAVPKVTETWFLAGTHTYKFRMVDVNGKEGSTEQVSITWNEPLPPPITVCTGDIIFGKEKSTGKEGTFCCIDGKVSLPIYDNQIGTIGQSCDTVLQGGISSSEICKNNIDDDHDTLIDEWNDCICVPTSEFKNVGEECIKQDNSDFSKLLSLLLIGIGLYIFGRRK